MGAKLRFLLLALPAGCATFEANDREPEPAREVRAQMEVKAALLDTDEVAAAPIRVEYGEGTVTLSGFVESEQESQAAARIARETHPELQVINELRVWGQQ